MKVETKIEIGKPVYFIHEKKVIESMVRRIKVEMWVEGKKQKQDILYLCSKDETEKQIYLKVSEEDAFQTKEALLKSL